MDLKGIKDIIENKADHIALKKSTMKFSDGWATPSTIIKSSTTKNDNVEDNGVINRDIVGNTNYWMDSHQDVHVPGNWSKTINDGGKKFHLHDHKFEIVAQVGKFNKIAEKTIRWKDLGVDKEGDTSGLVANTNIIKELNTAIYNSYKSGEIQQHSVGMRYVKLDFAVSPDVYDEEWNSQKDVDNWNEVYPMLGNPDEADKNGYFWVVREAKLIEISAVLMGSNSLTPTLENKQEPLYNTLANEVAEKSLQNLNQFYNNLKL